MRNGLVLVERDTMSNFGKCFCYLIATGVVAFFIGRLLPKKWFRADFFPYRSYSFEKCGHIYEKLKVRYWQNKVPDMSKILPMWIPAKNLRGDYKKRLPRMLQETCIAEMIHTVLCVTGLYCLKLYPGIGGVIVLVLYVLIFNLPFIIIQRYNRPRLIKIMNKQTDKKECHTVCEC